MVLRLIQKMSHGQYLSCVFLIEVPLEGGFLPVQLTTLPVSSFPRFILFTTCIIKTIFQSLLTKPKNRKIRATRTK